MRYVLILIGLGNLVGCGNYAAVSTLYAPGKAEKPTQIDTENSNFSPVIFATNDVGNFTDPGEVILTGVAPFQVHVASLPEVKPGDCYWDPFAWVDAGYHNLCSPPRAITGYTWASLAGTRASDLGRFFSANKSQLGHPVDLASNSDDAGKGYNNPCFEQTYDNDPLSQALQKAIAGCIRARDIRDEQRNSNDYFGGGDVALSRVEWDFGDLNTDFNLIDGYNAAHLYEKPGAYLVKLKVANDKGVGIKTLRIVVKPDNRSVVTINSDADLDSLYSYPVRNSLPFPTGRKVIFASGKTFHLTQPVGFYSNDWLTSTNPNSPAMLVGDRDNFLILSANNTPNRVVIDGIKVGNSPTNPSAIAYTNTNGGSVFFSGHANNITFKRIRFNVAGAGYEGVKLAFSMYGGGVLMQDVGNPIAADGSWTRNGVSANYLIATIKGLSLFGSHGVYGPKDRMVGYDSTQQKSIFGEPGVRFNGGELINVNSNNLGGSAGKFNTLSIRGAKRVYVANNVIRGGFFDISGVAADPNPGTIPVLTVIRDNVMENLNFMSRLPGYTVLLWHNSMRAHDDADTGFNALYPKTSSSNVTASTTNSLWGLRAEGFYLYYNAFQNDGYTIVDLEAQIANKRMVGNRFFRNNTIYGQPSLNVGDAQSTFSKFSGNEFYVPGNSRPVDGTINQTMSNLIALPEVAPLSNGVLVRPNLPLR